MSLWQMSLTGAVMIAIVVGIRRWGSGKLPRRVLPLLWLIVLCRLLLPFDGPLALWPSGQEMAAGGEAVIQPPLLRQETVLLKPAEAAQAESAVSRLRDWPWAALAVGGTVLMALYWLTVYVRGRQRFAQAQVVDNTFVRSWCAQHGLWRRIRIGTLPELPAPLTYGFWRPMILLPEDTILLSEKTDWADNERLDYILAHEYVHIRRGDALIKALLCAALCLHWFNPLVWVMFSLANRDLELACDEAVLASFGLESRQAYALTLLQMAEQKGAWQVMGAHFGKQAVTERVEAIVSYQDIKLSSKLLAGLLCVLLLSGILWGNGAREQAATQLILSNGQNRLMSAAQTGEEQTIVLEEVRLIWQDQEGKGYPYLHEVWTNHTDKTIIAYEQGMVAFDQAGEPLEIDWYAMDSAYEPTYSFLYDWGESNLAPGETEDLSGGWTFAAVTPDPQAERIAYALYCYKSITFADGTVWHNTRYDDWLDQYAGRSVDVQTLAAYYPFVQVVR